MGDVRIAKSCLSERLRAAKASGMVFDSAAGEMEGVRVAMKASQAMQSSKSCSTWCSANDIGSELQAIFAGDFNTNQASVFGCSPPQRATNPLSRDCQFHRVVLVNPNVADRKVSKDSFANRMSGV